MHQGQQQPCESRTATRPAGSTATQNPIYDEAVLRQHVAKTIDQRVQVGRRHLNTVLNNRLENGRQSLNLHIDSCLRDGRQNLVAQLNQRV